MKAYYLLSRLASPVITLLFHLYSLLTHTPRTRLLVQNEKSEILLLQVWPDTSVWALPGGGLERGELPEAAAARELREEAGIDVPAEEVKLCLVFHSHGHDEFVHRVRVPKKSLPAAVPNRWEVRRAGWFPLNSLPPLSSTTRRIIAEVAGQR
jgi:ADP-ribose pyrophosphatase YjhB (NUDIX family)